MVRAEEWLEKMAAAGVKPNVVHYTEVLDACAQAGDAKRAERWFQRMLADGVEADTICYNTVITAHARARDAARKWRGRFIQPQRRHCSLCTSRRCRRGGVVARSNAGCRRAARHRQLQLRAGRLGQGGTHGEGRGNP